ncbi:MAG: WbqC family protein [Burkholderiales bacterium]|nr:WbqC family protein [Burkholderiales bacterium]
MARADVFVYLDAVQFEKNSFTNRNRIKTAQGPLWLTIPVKSKGHTGGTLLDLAIDDTQPWRAKHLKSIEANYRKTPHFARYFPKLQALLDAPHATLAEFGWAELRFWCDEFGIATRLLRQSALQPTGAKSDLVLGLCRQLGADHYLSGALGRDYLDVPAFAAQGIAVEFQNFDHPRYPQLWGGDFEPFMSVVDFCMNCGADLERVIGQAEVVNA